MKDFTAIVEPSGISGIVQAPPSKSMMIRALAGAWLSRGVTRIVHPGYCRDALDVAQALENAGVGMHKSEAVWEVEGGKAFAPGSVFHVGESGLGARMFIPLAARYSYRVTVTGSGSLLKRPMQMVEDPMAQLGVEVETTNGFLPVNVKGPLSSGNITVDGSHGSQFITGLLMALPLVKGDSVLTVKNLRSRPYIDLTLEVIKNFEVEVAEKDPGTFRINGNQQYRATEISVEGDWSGAAFLLVAGAIAGEITVTGLKKDSRQADRKILDAMEKAGVEFRASEDEIIVKKSKIKPFTFDITHCPDLAPPLVALAAYGEGISVLSGAGRLLTKESNRAETLKTEAARLGIKVEQEGDTLLIHGGKVTGGEAHAHNDHRIAMTAAVMGLKAQNHVKINNAGCIEKSYPQFFTDLKKIGGEVYESIR